MSYSVVHRSSTKTIRKVIDCQGIVNKICGTSWRERVMVHCDADWLEDTS
jgi:hypothetical protein